MGRVRPEDAARLRRGHLCRGRLQPLRAARGPSEDGHRGCIHGGRQGRKVRARSSCGHVRAIAYLSTCAPRGPIRSVTVYVRASLAPLRSGKLDVFEASAVLGRKALDRGLKFQQVIDAFDVSGDGQIDFEEFERLFMMLVEIGLIERPRHAG